MHHELARVVLCTDFSESAQIAEEGAVDLLAGQGGRIALCHALVQPERFWLDMDGPLGAGARGLSQRARRALGRTLARWTPKAEAGGVKLQAFLLEGEDSEAAQLHTFAQQWGAELIVVGSHGADQAMRGVWGSTSARLASMSDVPVLILRPDVDPGFQRVLVPVDFSPASAEALRMAARFVAHHDAVRVHVLHVRPLPIPEALRRERDSADDGDEDDDEETLEALRVDAEAQIAHALTAIEWPNNVTVTHSATCDRPSTAILDYAVHHHIDLICMGAYARRPVLSRILGNTTMRVFRSAPCALLITRAHDTEEPADMPGT